MFREPEHMLQSPLCNTPTNIQIWGEPNSKQTDFKFHETTQIAPFHIIVWEEEKAMIADKSSFPPNLKMDAQKFKDEATPILKTEGFTDLGDVNIGYFSSPPHFRFYDIQPILEPSGCD